MNKSVAIMIYKCCVYSNLFVLLFMIGCCAGAVLPGCKINDNVYPNNELFVTKDCKTMCICQPGKEPACSPLCPPRKSMKCNEKHGIVIRYEVHSFEPKCSCRRDTCVQRFHVGQ